MLTHVAQLVSFVRNGSSAICKYSSRYNALTLMMSTWKYCLSKGGAGRRGRQAGKASKQAETSRQGEKACLAEKPDQSSIELNGQSEQWNV